MADTNLHKLLVLLIGLGAAGTLVALFVFAGRRPPTHGRPSGVWNGPAQRSSVRIGRGSRQAFAIKATAVGRLFPGGPEVPVELSFTNRTPTSMTVHDVTMKVSGVSVADCAADGIVVTQQLTVTPTVPPRSVSSLAQLAVPRSKWPRLRMLEGRNQDACQGATVALALSGSATSP